MRKFREWIMALAFLWNILLSGGCTRSIKMYPGPELDSSEIATLEFNPYHDTKVEVDGKPVDADTSFRVQVKLLPGLHELKWELKITPWLGNVVYRGHGMLDTKAGKKYMILCAYLVDETETLEYPYGYHPVKDYATWVQEAETGKILIGQKPSWAREINSTDILGQVIK